MTKAMQLDRAIAWTRIARNESSDEWQVKAYNAAGDRLSEADYFTDDLADAKATAKAMVAPQVAAAPAAEPKAFDAGTAKVGDVLPNGAVLLAIRAWAGVWVVLCIYQVGAPLPFVTWEMNRKGETYWGHYYAGIAKAMADWESR